MAEPSEREFEQFLQGKHPLDKQLNAERQDSEPSPELDFAIKQKAHAAVQPQARPLKRMGAQWALWSTAASLLLAGILLFHNPSPVTDRKPEPLNQSAPSASSVEQEALAEENLDASQAAPQAYSQAMEEAVSKRQKAETAQESARMAPSELRAPRPLAAPPAPEVSAPAPASSAPILSDAHPSANALETAKPQRLEKGLARQDEPALQSCEDLIPERDCPPDTKPVCALLDTGVRCITTPCPASTRQPFANACAACKADKVIGFHYEACPEQPSQ